MFKNMFPKVSLIIITIDKDGNDVNNCLIGCLLLLIVKALPLRGKAIKKNNKGREKFIITAILYQSPLAVDEMILF